MSQIAAWIQPAGERDGLGWPQFGWVRPTFNVPSEGIEQGVALGERVYWRQDNAWTAPVAITAEEHDAFVARLRVSQPNTPPT